MIATAQFLMVSGWKPQRGGVWEDPLTQGRICTIEVAEREQMVRDLDRIEYVQENAARVFAPPEKRAEVEAAINGKLMAAYGSRSKIVVESLAQQALVRVRGDVADAIALAMGEV